MTIQYIKFSVYYANQDIVKFFISTQINFVATSYLQVAQHSYVEYHIPYDKLTFAQRSLLIDYLQKSEYVENIRISKI